MKNKQLPPNFIYFLLLIFSIAILTPAGSSADDIRLTAGPRVAESDQTGCLTISPFQSPERRFFQYHFGCPTVVPQRSLLAFPKPLENRTPPVSHATG